MVKSTIGSEKMAIGETSIKWIRILLRCRQIVIFEYIVKELKKNDEIVIAGIKEGKPNNFPHLISKDKLSINRRQNKWRKIEIMNYCDR